MLRPRFSALRPRQKREIRHWAIELAVVVVGVLLALWAAEWAEERRGRADAARAREAIETELFDASAAVYNFRSSIPCSLDLLSQLEAALIADAPVPAVLLEEDGFIPFGLVIPPTLAREQAAASGAMAYIPQEQRVHYGRAYSYLETIGATTGRLNERVDAFAPLILGQPLTQPERNAMLSELQWMRTRLRGIEDLSDVMFERLTPLELGQRIDPDRAENFPQIIDGLRNAYGDCVAPPDIAPYRDLLEERPRLE